jgi:hypothetical protein
MAHLPPVGATTAMLHGFVLGTTHLQGWREDTSGTERTAPLDDDAGVGVR